MVVSAILCAPGVYDIFGTVTEFDCGFHRFDPPARRAVAVGGVGKVRAIRRPLSGDGAVRLDQAGDHTVAPVASIQPELTESLQIGLFNVVSKCSKPATSPTVGRAAVVEVVMV